MPIERSARIREGTRVRTIGHGASLRTAMTHIAIREALDGKALEWLEHVSEQHYQAKPTAN